MVFCSFGVSQRRPGFDPMSVHLSFVVDGIALGQLFIPALTVCTILHVFHGYHLLLVFTGTNGRSLGTIPKMLVRKSGSIG
jgi:hypothetical protein